MVTKIRRERNKGIAYLFRYDGVFSKGYIEDGRLAKLQVLLENPSEKVEDLEGRILTAFIKLTDKSRREITEKVYRMLYNLNLSCVYHWRAYYGFSLDRNDIEDVAETVTLQAIKNVDKFKADSYFLAWLFSISRYNLLSFVRDNQPKVIKFSELQLDFRNLTEAIGQNPRSHVEEIEAREAVEKLKRIYENLGKEEKVLLLLACDGCSYSEIGEKFGISRHTVKMRIRGIRERIALGFQGKMIKPLRRRWLESDSSLLVKMVNDGFNVQEIAEQLGRIELGVGEKVYWLSRENPHIFKPKDLKKFLVYYYKLKRA